MMAMLDKAKEHMAAMKESMPMIKEKVMASPPIQGVKEVTAGTRGALKKIGAGTKEAAVSIAENLIDSPKVLFGKRKK
jgi:hypothetical protein